MSAPVAAIAPFAGFGASVWTCVALLRRSPFTLGMCILMWGNLVLLNGLPDRGASVTLVIILSLVLSGSVLVALRSQLLSTDIYLPASARTRSVAIALVGTVSSALGLVGVLAVAAAVTGNFSVDATPMLPIILAVGAASTLPELWSGYHPRLGWITGVFFWTALLWQGASEVDSSGDLARLLPLFVAGVVLLLSRLPRSWLQYPAPAFLQGGIRDTAFPTGVADPILAVRALLAAERGRSVGWRLAPLAAYALVRWVAHPLPPGDHGGWNLLGWVGLPLFATIPFILPVSAFGVEATPVALTLPVAPLAVHHAVIREATIRAGMVFGAFVMVKASWFGVGALTSFTAPGDHVRTWIEVIGLYAWPIPAFALSLGASAWVSYPSPLRVFLVKVAGIATLLPLLVVFFIAGSVAHPFGDVMALVVQAHALLTLLGLLALLLGEIRARRAFRPYRSAP